jgi:maleylacetate reductase
VEGYHGVVKSSTHTFLPTERVHFGAGSIRKLAEEARAKARAFVVTGSTLHEKTDLVRHVEAILGGRHAGTFVGMSEHTTGSVVEKAAEWAHRVGVTDEAAGRKGGFTDPSAVPQVVILDPEATLFTPEKLWLSTGIRALDHTVEGFLFGGEHPITDVTGLEGARLLLAYLPRSREDPEDVEARLELQIAAWLAYFGPFNTPMGLSHALGRRIGASYEVPHGITSCITLAPSLKVARYQVQEHRWRKLEEDFGGDPAERIFALVGGLDLPSRLRDVGVPEGDLEEIAEEISGREGDALTILRDAY